MVRAVVSTMAACAIVAVRARTIAPDGIARHAAPTPYCGPCRAPAGPGRRAGQLRNPGLWLGNGGARHDYGRAALELGHPGHHQGRGWRPADAERRPRDDRNHSRLDFVVRDGLLYLHERPDDGTRAGLLVGGRPHPPTRPRPRGMAPPGGTQPLGRGRLPAARVLTGHVDARDPPDHRQAARPLVLLDQPRSRAESQGPWHEDGHRVHAGGQGELRPDEGGEPGDRVLRDAGARRQLSPRLPAATAAVWRGGPERRPSVGDQLRCRRGSDPGHGWAHHQDDSRPPLLMTTTQLSRRRTNHVEAEPAETLRRSRTASTRARG